MYYTLLSQCTMLHRHIVLRCTATLYHAALSNGIMLHRHIVLRCTDTLYYAAPSYCTTLHCHIILRCTVTLYYAAPSHTLNCTAKMHFTAQSYMLHYTSLYCRCRLLLWMSLVAVASSLKGSLGNKHTIKNCHIERRRKVTPAFSIKPACYKELS